MTFKVTTSWPATAPAGTLLLLLDRWNDWWQYRTQYSMYFVNETGAPIYIGTTKILNLSHTYVADDRPTWSALAEGEYETLPQDFVSVGQDADLYVNLHERFGQVETTKVLTALRDFAVNQELFEELRLRAGVHNSLMRSVTAYSVRRQYPRLIQFGDVKASFDFTFIRASLNDLAPPLVLDFEVVGGSTPPTNVHVLIGRNGAGKTSTLMSMGRYILGPSEQSETDGYIPHNGVPLEVANLVYVAFSAFDSPSLPVADDRENFAVPYAYVGLQSLSKAGELVTQTPDALAKQFADSAWLVATSKSHDTWVAVLTNLESDPIFAAAGVTGLAALWNENSEETEFTNSALALYRRLSSGHKIVLLTVTRLVETVSEQTLVLMDEPEGHLHPPLLSAFTRTLSDLMRDKSGIAIIATHSPVVLQEVPRKAAWRIRRTGTVVQGRRPVMETFGENVGVLTNSVFGLEVSDSGFHRLIIEAAKKYQNYEAVMEHFGHELGFEARGILLNWFDDGPSQ